MSDSDEVLAPTPDPDDDLSHLAVFADDDAEGVAASADGGAARAAYDNETDLAVPVHEPDAGTAFTPFGASVPDAVQPPAYDVDRDTAR